MGNIETELMVVCRGWGNLGEGFDVPDSVMLLDNVPHDWLLPHCCAVVHHGGAGTTAAGVLCCAVLCCAVLCYTVLHCAVLCCDTLYCCAMLYCAAL